MQKKSWDPLTQRPNQESLNISEGGMEEFSLDTLKLYFDQAAAAVKRIQFTKKKQLGFLEDLYLLINDGIPANRAVEMMAQVTQGLTREVASSLSQKIAEGQPLAEGMKEWFAPNVV